MEKKKVMVVDDEEELLKIVKLNLEETNQYDVMTLSSAKDIISHVHAFRPDIILLDLLMPGIGGIEACEILNNDPVGRRIPIIIVSALDKEQDKLKAYKLGVVDYITKPIGKDNLVAKIEKVLRYK
ncbi:MAG: response regulator [Candidatus Omnitrophota bacterium]|nr:response regulator [Candidatus Omnitrophota bacterium]